MTARTDNSATEGDVARARPVARRQTDGGPEAAG